jgi:hypothetical protein
VKRCRHGMPDVAQVQLWGQPQHMCPECAYRLGAEYVIRVLKHRREEYDRQQRIPMQARKHGAQRRHARRA